MSHIKWSQKSPMSDRVPPNLRVIHVLEVMAESGQPMTPTELNQRIGWPKQTIHRLCQTMIAHGLLERHNKRLQIAPRTIAVATGLSRLAVGRTACHQILVRIAAEVGETVNFVRPEKRGMIYVDRVETNWPFRIMLPVGTHVPFHCTASGKTFLSSLPSIRRQQLVKSLNLEAHTENTHIDVETLEAELRAVRKDGFALDREEFHSGMVAIAVPVTDAAGRYYAALACHGPIQRFNLADAKARYNLLLTASAEISAILFGSSATA